MGQAFDRDGNVLGEAYGETKGEVFEKLNDQFRDAIEIRIKSLEQRIAESNPNQAASNSAASAELPRYRSHKEVWALKIRAVLANSVLDGSALIIPEDDGYAEFRVDAAYVTKHNPQAGGYYVVYADGYKSFSPAEAFEGGYTRICSAHSPRQPKAADGG